ncbi:T9SS-dependent choice-of-anchor J family protein [Flavobacterium sp. NRK F7]|uniref:T9SS-dependent choice-of-anchor J family protein n=1 Tax=Flavobacterium sp. NRK F7 TaxID=2954930 RepID=UPI002091E0BE|nr:choice-of-anchor J domain-containing protein [Flavobacterium sp. NRK F7]MCO6163885.1 choice-of-anchor J domain-containing protein [Flavobacterium sp. NRK F7]
MMKKNYSSFWGVWCKTLLLLSLSFPFLVFSGSKPKKPKSKNAIQNVIYDPASYMALTVNGFNEDVIANGVGSLNTTTTNDVDGVNFCYLAQGTQITSGSTPTIYGLPTDGVLAVNNSDLFFNLAPYDSNNSLRIQDNGVSGLSTITFTELESFENLYLAVTSGSGASSVIITVNFTDASSQVFTSVTIPDWFNSNALPTIISGIGRGSRLDNGLENPTNNPRIYQLDLAIDLANQSKIVSGITVEKSSGGVFNLFAVSGKLVPECSGPSNINATTVTAFDAAISWTGANVGDAFEVAIVNTGDPIPASGDASTTNTYNFSNLNPETTYDVYVRTACSGGGYSFWAGPYTFTTAVACEAPTNLGVAGITTSEAVFSWDAGTATEWEYVVLASGSPEPTMGNTITMATTGSLSGLMSNTSYDFYVRANCGANGYSAWTLYTFVTACSVVTSLNEDFESTATGAIPNCWSLINGGDANTWAVQSNFPAYPHSGTKFARITYSGTAHNDLLITPPFTVTANVSDIISFWSRNYSATYIDRFNVLVSTTGNQLSDFTDVLASNVGPSTTYTEYTYDLSAYVGQTIYVAIQAISTDQYYLFIDDLKTLGTPICDAPTNLSASNITYTSAVLSWDAGAGSEWEIAVQEYGNGEPVSGEVVSSVTYNATYPSGTVSEFYVRTVCDNNTGFSPWAGPFVFGGYTELEIFTGLNEDVIANGIGPSASSTTNSIDGGNFVLLSRDFKLNAPDSDLTFGLPTNGIINSASVPGLVFKINPLNNPYEGNNVLRIDTNGAANGGTLGFDTISNAEILYFLVTSGGGSSTVSGTIHFDDGSNQIIPATLIPDWYNQTSLPIAVSGIGRVNTNTDAIENPAGNPRIYELAINIDPANQEKTFTYVDFQKDSGTGIVNIFAASIKYPSINLANPDFLDTNTIKFFPNPVNSLLNLELTSEASKLQVINLLGQVLIEKEENLKKEMTVDMSHLQSGAYIINVTIEGKIQSVKVIKK